VFQNGHLQRHRTLAGSKWPQREGEDQRRRDMQEQMECKLIYNTSSFKWDEQKGFDANSHDGSARVWEDYVKKHPKAKNFRNNGWPIYQEVLNLMPSIAKGANVYYPGASQTSGQPSATPAGTQSPDSDEDEDEEEEEIVWAPTPPCLPSPDCTPPSRAASQTPAPAAFTPSTPVPHPQKCKSSGAAGPQAKRRVSGPEVLQGLDHSMKSFTNVFQQTMAAATAIQSSSAAVPAEVRRG